MRAIETLTPHPRNPNTHSREQIERLAKLIEYQGFRHPIIVSKRSGFVVAGHGRLEAAKRLAMTEVPVDEQDFESDEAEYAFLVSDNAIAQWASLDLSAINLELPELGPDFDIDLLGLKDFALDPSELAIEAEGNGEKKPDDIDEIKQCPNCGHMLR
jgi:hypothetical protein